jgi:hypothetical protein
MAADKRYVRIAWNGEIAEIPSIVRLGFCTLSFSL